MYDDRTNWISGVSEHFIYKYLPDSEAEKDIERITKNRELAYKNISACLGIKPDEKLKLYFVPDITTAHELKMMVDAAVPHLNFASLLYNNVPFCREKICYGHEIAHLLAYYWDRKIYHIEILEEGLAVYLDQSGSDKHLDYLSELRHEIGTTYLDLSFDVEPFKWRTNYKKAGSLAKFLIENYGLDNFKKLYLKAEVDLKDNVFYTNRRKLPKSFLKTLIKDIYHKDHKSIQNEWLSCLGFSL